MPKHVVCTVKKEKSFNLIEIEVLMDCNLFLTKNKDMGYQEGRLTFAFALHTLEIPSDSSARLCTGQRLKYVLMSREKTRYKYLTSPQTARVLVTANRVWPPPFRFRPRNHMTKFD